MKPKHALQFLTYAPPERRPPPARPSKGFLKPSSDDEDSGPSNTSMPSWKKSSNPARESASFEKPQQEKDPGKTVTAIQDVLRGDKAAATTSRFEALCLVALKTYFAI